MLTLEPKLGAFLLNTTQSSDLQEAFHKVFSEYLSLKISALEKIISDLEKKYTVDYEHFLLFYKSNHDEITENDFYLWDETISLLDHYKEIKNNWI